MASGTTAYQTDRRTGSGWWCPNPPGVRRRTGPIVLGTVVLLGLAVWGNWPYLVSELARLEPVHRWLIWAADGTALAWMLWFGVWHGVLGRSVPAGTTDRTFRWVLLTLAAGLAADTTGTADVAYREERGFKHAVPAQQAVLTGGRPSRNGVLAYTECRIQDQAGAWHDSRLCLRLDRHPAAMGAAIQGGQFPIPVPVKYDPDWPARCWVDPADGGGHEPIYMMLICILIFQGLLVLAAGVHYVQKRPTGALLPVYKIVPVWGVMLPLSCAAFGKLLLGEW